MWAHVYWEKHKGPKHVYVHLSLVLELWLNQLHDKLDDKDWPVESNAHNGVHLARLKLPANGEVKHGAIDVPMKTRGIWCDDKVLSELFDDQGPAQYV